MMGESSCLGVSGLLVGRVPVPSEHKTPSTIEYRTFDKEGTEVLRLSFKPVRILAGGTALAERGDLKEQGYTTRPLPGGDYVIRINHTKSNELIVRGG